MASAERHQWNFPKNEAGTVLGWEPVAGRWLENKPFRDRLLLTDLGCVGDGVTDDSAAFLNAARTAALQGRGLGSLAGKTYLLAGSLATPAVLLDVSIDLDLNGSTLKAAVGDGASENAPYPMIETALADNVSVVIRNGIIDGGVPTGLASSSAGDRLFNLEGGDLVWFDRMTIQNGSNRQANIDVDANGDPDPGGAVNHLLASSYKVGDIRVHDAKIARFTYCSFLATTSEMLIVTSSDASTVLDLRHIYTTKKNINDDVLSNSFLGAFNLHRSTYVGWIYAEFFHKSMMNYLCNGGLIEHVYGNGVADSSLIDTSEVGRQYCNNVHIRHIWGKDVNNSVVYATGSQMLIEHITAVDCGRAVMVDQDLVTWDAQGDWWDGTERETSGVLVRNIDASGSVICDIEIDGVSASYPAHVTIEDACIKAPSSHPTFGVDASDCVLTVRGMFAAGSDALIRMTGYAKFIAQRAIFAPTSGADLMRFHASTVSDIPVFEDCKRTTSLSGGEYDLGFSSSNTVSVDQVHLIRSPTINAIQTLAPVRNYNGPGYIHQLADDDIISIIPPRKQGYLAIGRNLNSSGPGGSDMGILRYNVTSSPAISATEFGQTIADMSVGTTALTQGTSDGVDGRTCVAALSTGVIQIKNRQGAVANFQYQFLL